MPAAALTLEPRLQPAAPAASNWLPTAAADCRRLQSSAPNWSRGCSRLQLYFRTGADGCTRLQPRLNPSCRRLEAAAAAGCRCGSSSDAAAAAGCSRGSEPAASRGCSRLLPAAASNCVPLLQLRLQDGSRRLQPAAVGGFELVPQAAAGCSRGFRARCSRLQPRLRNWSSSRLQLRLRAAACSPLQSSAAAAAEPAAAACSRLQPRLRPGWCRSCSRLASRDFGAAAAVGCSRGFELEKFAAAAGCSRGSEPAAAGCSPGFKQAAAWMLPAAAAASNSSRNCSRLQLRQRAAASNLRAELVAADAAAAASRCHFGSR